MSEQSTVLPPRSPSADSAGDLLEQYGCGPIRFSGHNDALYERHLLFDDVVDPLAAGGRERFEAAARWLGLDAADGRCLLLSTASLSTLGYEHKLAEPAIRLWNDNRHVELT